MPALLTNRCRAAKPGPESYFGFGEAPVPGVTPEGGVLVTPLLPSPGVAPAAVLTCVVAPLEVWPLPVEPPVVLPPLVLEVAAPEVALPWPLPAPPVLLTLWVGVLLLPPAAPVSAVPPVLEVLPPDDV